MRFRQVKEYEMPSFVSAWQVKPSRVDGDENVSGCCAASDNEKEKEEPKSGIARERRFQR